MTASIVSFHNVLWSWHLAARSHFVILALHSWTHWQSSFDKCATMRAASHLYDFYPLRFVAGTACQSVHETLFTDKLLLPKESPTTRFLRSSTRKVKGMWVNAKLNGKVLLNVALLFEKKHQGATAQLNAAYHQCQVWFLSFKLTSEVVCLTIFFEFNVLHTRTAARKDQEMEQQGEVQHDVELRTTWWG